MIVVSLDINNKQDKSNVKLKGTTTFPGNVTGYAFLIRNKVKKSIKLKKDLILVAEATYPNDLPVMLKMKGIIVENKGLLSHTGIVSREFKIPCIVGVNNATKIIKDGDKITIKSGVVIVEKK